MLLNTQLAASFDSPVSSAYLRLVFWHQNCRCFRALLGSGTVLVLLTSSAPALPGLRMSGSLPVLMLIRRQCRPLFSALTHFASHSAGGSGRDSNSTSGNFDEGDGFVLLGGGSSDNTSKTPTLRCRSCEKLLKNLQTSTSSPRYLHCESCNRLYSSSSPDEENQSLQKFNDFEGSRKPPYPSQA
ncbi:unnamed protein product [Enterobius vermicularis]|uniref:Zinc_ribbon_12 domain-containing protein n=1 Tax=Enterobius vermicularis TaxID=51028 RepID=A0A0N4VJ34_ENTVE|nr:unnamed protein product [Enterobius vermicularis]